MKINTIKDELNSLAYHGRGIIIGKSADGKKAVTAYFIMGRSVNSRNRVFVAEGGLFLVEALGGFSCHSSQASLVKHGFALRHVGF